MEEFRESLIQLINNTQLPPEAMYYIIKDIYRDAQEAYESYLIQRKQQKQSEVEETTKEE